MFKTNFQTITLYDLAILFGLCPHRLEIDLVITIDTTNFNTIIPKGMDYEPFTKEKKLYVNKTNEVSNTKHITFLQGNQDVSRGGHSPSNRSRSGFRSVLPKPHLQRYE